MTFNNKRYTTLVEKKKIKQNRTKPTGAKRAKEKAPETHTKPEIHKRYTYVHTQKSNKNKKIRMHNL